MNPWEVCSRRSVPRGFQEAAAAAFPGRRVLREGGHALRQTLSPVGSSFLLGHIPHAPQLTCFLPLSGGPGVTRRRDHRLTLQDWGPWGGPQRCRSAAAHWRCRQVPGVGPAPHVTSLPRAATSLDPRSGAWSRCLVPRVSGPSLPRRSRTLWEPGPVESGDSLPPQMGCSGSKFTHKLLGRKRGHGEGGRVSGLFECLGLGSSFTNVSAPQRSRRHNGETEAEFTGLRGGFRKVNSSGRLSRGWVAPRAAFLSSPGEVPFQVPLVSSSAGGGAQHGRWPQKTTPRPSPH